MYIRPVIEYGNVVYHSLLSSETDIMIENLQKQELKMIYGRTFSYRKCLELSGLKSLKEQRKTAVKKFALKVEIMKDSPPHGSQSDLPQITD